MGGNVSVMSMRGDEVFAQKVDLRTVDRSNFIKTSQRLFKVLNTTFEAKNGVPLWPDEKQLLNATVYNGSTSFVMSNDFTDDEILKVKPTVGDIDIAVPAQNAEKLFHLLYQLRGKAVTGNAEFVGMNRTESNKLGTQINCIFKFKTPIEYLVQVDFEFLPFDDFGAPTEWARFSHSSSFEDTKMGVKALHHKYLIRAMIGALSVRDDIVVATPKSTPDNIKLSKKDSVARMLKFSVDHGVRIAYEPFLDDNGNEIYYEGKKVFKEIPTAKSDYKKTVLEIYQLAFGDVDESEAKLLWTFQGTLKLIQKHLTKDQIKKTAARYFEMLWGVGRDGGQKLERGSPEADSGIKGAGWFKFIETLKIPNVPGFEKRLEQYYENY